MRRVVRDGYDAGRYAEVFRDRTALTGLERRFLDRFIGLIGPRPRIVDFGCGTGVPYDRYLVERGAELTGLDISRNHLSQARTNVPGATFIETDFSAWQPAAPVDAVMSLYAIFHIPRDEHEGLFRRMADMLVPGGVLLCTLAAQPVDADEVEWLGAPMVWSSHGPDFYIDLIGRAGMTLLEQEFEGKPGDEEHHLWLLAQKAPAP